MSNLVISTNVAGLNSHRSLKITSERNEKASEKLSSGYKINRAGDDAAGLAISEKMRNQIKGLNMASKNSADGISLIQTAEGALQEVHEMLKRMRELVIQGANDTNVSADRGKIGAELGQLCCEINATAAKTEYNTKKLIDGSRAADRSAMTGLRAGKDGETLQSDTIADAVTTGATNKIFLQVGANGKQNIQFNIAAMSCGALGLNVKNFTSAMCGGKLGISGRSWSTLLTQVDSAISAVSVQRSNLGALQNRLEHTIKNLDVASENLSAAESRIRDTDMAASMMEYTKTNILSQAGMSMLSQANQAPNNVLSIIR